MENVFIVNPRADVHDLENALHEKLLQMKAMTTCILFSLKELDSSILYDAIWAIDSFMDTVCQLKENL